MINNFITRWIEKKFEILQVDFYQAISKCSQIMLQTMFALKHWNSSFFFNDNRYKLNRSCRAMIYQWPVEVFHKVNLLDSWFVLSKAFTRLDNTTCTSITPFFIKSLSIHYCKLSSQLVLFLISSLHVHVFLL